MEKSEMLKKCREYNNSNDYLYYLIYRKQYDVYAVINAPCNYLYRNDEDQFFGTCIYTSENNISDEMADSVPEGKNLFGIPMVKIASRKENGKVSALDNRQTKELPLRYRLDSVPRFSSPFIPAYSCFECEDVIDIIEPRKALANLCRRNADYASFVSALTERFKIAPEQLGMAGSAALCADSIDDYDIVFYGDAAELKRINGIQAEINRVQGVPKLNGFPLPFRMIFGGHAVDTLFVYEPPVLGEIQFARQIRSDVPFRCCVTDDPAGMQVGPYLKVSGEDYSAAVLADSFFHAVIQKGDIIEGRGDLLQWEHNGGTENIIYCRYPFDQLIDFTRYFYRQE